MFRTRLNFHITAIIVYILYIFAFKYFFAPLHYGILFYIAAIAYVCPFWYFTGDCTTKEEAERITRETGSIAMYKSDTGYALTCIAAILILLASITLLLVTMVLNQHGVTKVDFGIQFTLFIFNCYGFLYIDEIYLIGHHDYTVRKRTSSAAAKPEAPAEPAVPARQTVTKTPVPAHRTAVTPTPKPAAPAKPTPPARPATPVRPVTQTRTVTSSGIAGEVEKFLFDIIEEELGVPRWEITMQSDLMNDLGADEVDVDNIHNKLEEFIYKKYGEHPHFIKRSYTDSQMLKSLHNNMDQRAAARSSSYELSKKMMELHYIAPTVRDYLNLYTEIVTIIKKYH